MRFMELSYPVCYLGFYVRKAAALQKCQRYSRNTIPRDSISLNLKEAENIIKKLMKMTGRCKHI